MELGPGSFEREALLSKDSWPPCARCTLYIDVMLSVISRFGGDGVHLCAGACRSQRPRQGVSIVNSLPHSLRQSPA